MLFICVMSGTLQELEVVCFQSQHLRFGINFAAHTEFKIGEKSTSLRVFQIMHRNKQAHVQLSVHNK